MVSFKNLSGNSSYDIWVLDFKNHAMRLPEKVRMHVYIKFNHEPLPSFNQDLAAAIPLLLRKKLSLDNSTIISIDWEYNAHWKDWRGEYIRIEFIEHYTTEELNKRIMKKKQLMIDLFVRLFENTTDLAPIPALLHSHV